ncbi:MAG: hypothetical protein N0C86_11410 [Candidatus Thiodiazotropha taylori]|nr:hypothetical protein [Candidatus Thiodiazotropha taylori]MCW4326594.1 hypothetical protein [Candidatus Thiodiazotropha taylori]
MRITEEGYVAIASVLIGVNAYASVMLWQNWSYSAPQKVAQSLIIWLIPFVGAWVVMKLMSDDEPRGPNTPPFGGGANDSIGVQDGAPD